MVPRAGPNVRYRPVAAAGRPAGSSVWTMDAGDWDARYAAAELVWSVTPNQFVAAELADLPPGRALDVAAGEGRNAIWLASLGWEVTAADFSRVALDKGRRLADEQALAGTVHWEHADATTWESPVTYDAVVVAYLQLPADQRRSAVRRAFDALRPGGTFLLVAHDSTNLTEGTGGPQDPAVLMTAEDVLGDLDDRSYDVVRAGRVARTVGDGHSEGARPDRLGPSALLPTAAAGEACRGVSQMTRSSTGRRTMSETTTTTTPGPAAVESLSRPRCRCVSWSSSPPGRRASTTPSRGAGGPAAPRCGCTPTAAVSSPTPTPTRARWSSAAARRCTTRRSRRRRSAGRWSYDAARTRPTRTCSPPSTCSRGALSPRRRSGWRRCACAAPTAAGSPRGRSRPTTGPARRAGRQLGGHGGPPWWTRDARRPSRS